MLYSLTLNVRRVLLKIYLCNPKYRGDEINKTGYISICVHMWTERERSQDDMILWQYYSCDVCGTIRVEKYMLIECKEILKSKESI